MKKFSLRMLCSLLAVAMLCNVIPAAAVEISEGDLQAPEAESMPMSDANTAEIPSNEELELFALPTETLSGTCGDNLTWTLTPEGVLTISGSGAMYDYQGSSNTTPWYPYLNGITELHLPEGMTHIGAYAFWSMYNLEELIIPSTVKTIGRSGCSYLRKITHLESPA